MLLPGWGGISYSKVNLYIFGDRVVVDVEWKGKLRVYPNPGGFDQRKTIRVHLPIP